MLGGSLANTSWIQIVNVEQCMSKWSPWGVPGHRYQCDVPRQNLSEDLPGHKQGLCRGVPQDGTGFMLYSHKDNTYSPAVPKALKVCQRPEEQRAMAGFLGPKGGESNHRGWGQAQSACPIPSPRPNPSPSPSTEARFCEGSSSSTRRPRYA